MLTDQDILTSKECEEIESGLNEILNELQNGTFVIREELEDIHMNIEQALIDRIGDTGRKLHTGRSRNDQVSTDLRLWIRDSIDRVDELLEGLQAAFVNRCQGDFDVIVPAYTHLQRAQPVLLPHVWLAYCEKFQRDRERLADCRKRVNLCSLGTAALAGTTLPIDRDNTAKRLDFEGLVANSIDSSSDRDFVMESIFCLTTISIHLSTWAEGMDFVGHFRIRFHPIAACFLHRFFNYAAKNQSGRPRADPGENRPCNRKPSNATRALKRPATGLQSRLTGRQATAFRCLRYRHRLFGIGSPTRFGGENETRINRFTTRARGSSTPRH